MTPLKKDLFQWLLLRDNSFIHAAHSDLKLCSMFSFTFKTLDFSVLNIIIKSKQMFLAGLWAVMAQLYSGKGGREQELMCI